MRIVEQTIRLMLVVESFMPLRLLLSSVVFRTFKMYQLVQRLFAAFLSFRAAHAGLVGILFNQMPFKGFSCTKPWS
jgi:hypothetical protein